MQLPRRVFIREVGPRDGLQPEQRFLETEKKIELVNRLLGCGIRMVEATSFVSPRAIPQLRDAEAVVGGVGRPPGAVISALVGNARGVERARQAGVDEVQVVISASESHNRRNVNMSIEQSLDQLDATIQAAAGTSLRVRAAVAVAFGCPFEGEIGEARIKEMIKGYHQRGIRQVTLADTAGMGNPRQVFKLVSLLREAFPDLELALHFHDTRGLGLANALAGMQAGVEILESSIGGLGGCPFIPRATGNIATEDLVNMCELMGVNTGVDLARLLLLARWLQGEMGRQLPGRLLKLGDEVFCR